MLIKYKTNLLDILFSRIYMRNIEQSDQINEQIYVYKYMYICLFLQSCSHHTLNSKQTKKTKIQDASVTWQRCRTLS